MLQQPKHRASAGARIMCWWRVMQVLAYDAEKTWYSASETVSATTYQSPHDVELLSATSSSIYVAWVSSPDDSILQHTFEYTKVVVRCRVMLFYVSWLCLSAVRPPRFDLHCQLWSMLNRFRAGRGQCAASLHKWQIASSDKMLA